MGDWTFFSNYGHVLVCLARNHQARLRDVAEDVGITERAVQKIVRDLQDAGFLTVTKQGRCNRYRINRRKSLRHALESQCTVGKLLALLASTDKAGGAEAAPDSESAPRSDTGAAVTPFPVPSSGAVPHSADAGDADRKARSAEPEGATDPEPGELAAENRPKPESASEKESKKEQSPADTRQQRSLF